MPQRERNCGTCAWNHEGFCRYDPPLAEVGFPEVWANQFCRHHAFTRGWDDNEPSLRAPHQSFEAKNADEGELLGLIKKTWSEYLSYIHDWHLMREQKRNE